MAARVQVIVEAKDAASGVLRAITGQMGAFGGIIEEITSKNVNWGNVTQQATQLVIDGLKQSISATTQYAESVRDLSLISGESAENTSRFLQVLDDYQLGAEDAEAATRKLTQNGLAPNIETLAQLSDQYLAINNAQERNKFIIDNLGRSGLQWVNVLNQGSAALLEQGAAVDESLVLTEQNVRAAEEYRLTLDSWNDSVEALKIEIGTGLLPVLTQSINLLLDTTAAMDAVTEATGRTDQRSRIYMMAIVEQNQAIIDSANYYARWGEALEKNESQISDSTEQVVDFKDQMNTLKEILKGDLGEAQDDYNAKMAEYNAQLAEARTQKEKDVINANIAEETAAYNERALAIAFNIQQEAILNSTMPSEDKIGMITSLGQAYGMYDEATAATIASSQELIGQVEAGNMTWETAAQYLKGTAFNLKQTGAAAKDISEPIMHIGNLSKHTASDFGIMKEAQAALADGLNSEAAPALGNVQNGLQSLPPSGSAWDYSISIHTSGSVPNLPTAGGSGSGDSKFGGEAGDDVQVGGLVYAGGHYNVGERGMESFFPRTDGRIIGHAEALNALRGGGGAMNFYGPVTLEIAEGSDGGLLGMR